MEELRAKVGQFIEIPNLGRSQIKYVGQVADKPGIYVGVDLLSNIGKNDGSFNGRKYFETTYARSGLFIQLERVAALLEGLQPSAVNGSQSQDETPADFNSPTPYRTLRIASRHKTESTPNLMEQLHECEARISRQTEQILKYRRLLDEQRQVLEDVQPAMDQYQEDIVRLKAEVERLKAGTKEDQEDKNLEELQQLRQYRDEMESARIKWDKEKQQLQMHNTSLSKELQALLMGSNSNT